MVEETSAREYELTFLVRAEEAAPEVLSALKKHGAEVTNQGTLARQRLAYPIKKETQAVLGSLTFRLDPADIAALDHDLRFNSHILRFLLITPPVAKPQGIVYERHLRPVRPAAPSPAGAPEGERRVREAAPKRPEPSHGLSNEALEKKLEEILQ